MTTYTNVFTGVDSTDISTGSTYPMTEVVGDMERKSNELRSTTTASEPRARMEQDAASPDMTATITIGTLTFGGEISAGAMARFSAIDDTAYLAVWDGTAAAGTLYLISMASGVYTILASTARTLVTTDTIGCRTTGTTIESLHNGASINSVVDSSITTGTRAGVDIYWDGTAVIGITQLALADVSAGGATFAPPPRPAILKLLRNIVR